MMYTRLGLASLCLLLTTFALLAQPQTTNPPLDGIAYNPSAVPPPVLQAQPVRDSDVMWEKRVWRVIDTREKINLPFCYPEASFVETLLEGVATGALTAYGVEDDRFKQSLSIGEIDASVNTTDTVWVTDLETMEVVAQPIVNEFDPSQVIRYRLQEIWFFNKKTSRMEVRILGIAPLIEVYDDNGNFRYERPMFWVHYPSSRAYLAEQSTYLPGNDRGRMSWADRLDMRLFDSHVYKESNVHDRRLSDYLSGVDLLWEGELIEKNIQNKEHDLWSW